MPRWCIGKDGVVVNVVNVEGDEPVEKGFDVYYDASDVVSPGDSYDPKDVVVNKLDTTVLQILFRHENLNRQLIRALRAVSTQANNAATAAGLPTTAASPDVTVAQFRTFIKNQIT